MRKALVCIVLTGMFAFAAIPALARKQLSGKYTQGQIDLACINAGGQVTSGSGPGGFGCKTDGGEISCKKTGTLNQGPVGSCTACNPSCSMDRKAGGRPASHSLGSILRGDTIVKDRDTPMTPRGEAAASDPVVRDHRAVVRDHRTTRPTWPGKAHERGAQ